jgi:SAM-dependent methyltransferase
MTEPFRHERAGVAFPQMAWTSFDRYGRYGAIVRALRANLGDGRLRVLDVGDTAGHLEAFDPALDVVGIDLNVAAERLADPVIVRADGTRLPFPDGAFDVVVSSDVLEHVPASSRPAFLAELVRVSGDLVIVAAPFDTPGVAGVEELVRRYALLSTGTKQLQLDEHQENGLPDLDASISALTAGGAQLVVQGDGHLWDWLVVMLLRFQLESRPALEPLAAGYDVLYNLSLADRSLVPPYYRHLLVARHRAEPQTGARAPSGDVPSDFAALAAALISADSTEVTRQDTVPRLDRLQADIDSVHARLDRMEPMVGQLGELRNRLESLIDLQVSVADQLFNVRDKVRRLTHPFKRGSGDRPSAPSSEDPTGR